MSTALREDRFVSGDENTTQELPWRRLSDQPLALPAVDRIRPYLVAGRSGQ